MFLYLRLSLIITSESVVSLSKGDGVVIYVTSPFDSEAILSLMLLSD